MKLIKKIFINGKIELLSGLHIGGSSTALDIGGIDSNVIKNANGIPYIPGSSIKGKMRSLLEMKYSEYTQYTGLVDNGKVDKNGIYKKLTEYDKNQKKEVFSKKFFVTQYGELFKKEGINESEVDKLNKDDLLEKLYSILESKHKEVIIKLFGSVAKESDFKTRLIVRDAFLNDNIFRQMKDKTGNFEKLELDYTEGKWENTIDRLTSAAMPRQLERVPAGAYFDFSIVFTFYEESDNELVKMLLEGMQLLEDDYLGGSGSRGYGQIVFKDISILEKTAADYQKHINQTEIMNGETLDQLNPEKL